MVENDPQVLGRILVVDDVHDSAISFATMLEIYGAQTRVAHDGLEAVAAAATFRPHVILMDVSMPRLNGYEAARRIRNEPWGRSMQMVAITGWGQDRDVRDAYDAGFDGHLLSITGLKPPALAGQL